MPRRLRTVIGPAVAVLLAATTCGSTSQPTTAADPGPGASVPAPRPTGSLTVFAAASLTEALNDLQTNLKTSDPGLSITYNFAGSGALVTQVQQGAPADVVATADTASMQRLVDAGQVEAPAVFARNKLEILVAPRNPRGVRALSDLSRADLKVVLGDETVPAGKYAAQALQAAGVTVRPVSKEVDVKAAVAKVTSGEADATIVYLTDVRAAGSKAQGVGIPDGQNVVADYPIAIVKPTRNPSAAAAFVEAVRAGRGQQALRQRGFLVGV